ncbi:hypothetical protein MTO96_011697 [Rhipicephalus appendiculatus]
MVDISTDLLPKNKPRYLMGVGFAVDLVVCSALGCDMFDCVFPTRTARFGCALYTRAYLHRIVKQETVACHLVSIHNVNYQMRLMKSIRDNIKAGTFVDFVKTFMKTFYPKGDYPSWVTAALAAVNVHLDS